jgi:hypothetical protein
MWKFLVTADFAADTTIGDFFGALAKHSNPTIHDFVANGPAGGNPCVSLLFNMKVDAQNFLKEHNDHDSIDDWIDGQISTVDPTKL